MANVLISLDHVDLVYSGSGSGLRALSDVSLQADDGEFVAIVGPSGCGKSTLLKLVSGLLSPSAGQVMVGGQIVQGPPPDVGIVFQSPLLMPWRTIKNNVLVQIEMRNLPIRNYAQEASDLLRLVGLQAFEDALPHQLSGGMQQRVGICRALVHRPRLLIMDEPFGALDALTREQMMIELQRIWQERRTTILFITHSISEAVFLADRILVFGPRPGHVVGEFDVDLPRPRSLAGEGTAAFAAVANAVRACLEGAGVRAS